MALHNWHRLIGPDRGHGRKQVRANDGWIGGQDLVSGSEHVCVATLEECDDGLAISLLGLAGEQAGLLKRMARRRGLCGLRSKLRRPAVHARHVVDASTWDAHRSSNPARAVERRPIT